MKKILVVDDEHDVRAVVSQWLSANGFEVLEAPDGPSGLALAKERHPDLILLDILMAGQDGVETYHALRKDSNTKAIPIILLTALAENISLAKQPLELGGSFAILGKPYRAQDLVREIRLALGESVIERRAEDDSSESGNSQAA